LFVLLVFVSALSLATVASGAPPPRPDKKDPSTPRRLTVTSATQSAVTAAWEPSWDNVGIAGYGVYVDGRMKQTETSPRATVSGLACGIGYTLSVDAFDAAGNRSRRMSTAVATAPCTDTQAPTAPTGFRQAATTRDSVVLAWDPSTDNVGVVAYGVYRGGILVQSPSTPSLTLSGLLCGSTYGVLVDAADAAGNRSSATSTFVQTAACADGQAPSTPTGLTVTRSTDTSITVTWSPSSDNVGVAGYGVFRGGTRVATTTQTTYTVSALSCDTAYTLGVDAYDAAGNHSPAATISWRTAACPAPPADTTPPSAPGGLSIGAATITTIDLTWTAAADNVGVTGYGVYVNGTQVQTATALRATVSALACGTGYTLAVDAVDAAGNRSAKASVIGTTAACPDTQPPTAPANLVTTSRTATSIALSWSASTDNVGVVGYGLYRDGTLVGTSSVTTGIFAGLACNTSYSLAIDAYDAAGNRSQKTGALVTTTACPDTTAPSTPTGLAAANVGQTSLTLNWNASSDNVAVAGYDVYRNSAKMASVATTSSSQTGLACGTSYAFGVIAYDAAGNRSSQASLTASTAACSPPPPPPPPPPPQGSPVLQGVDGGLGYYGRFSNGLPTAATYFPIGAWLRPAFDPEHFGDYASFGMNVFVGVENPEMTDEAMIGANGMRALIQAEERTRFNGLGSETAGWLVGDEHDMQFGPGIDTTNCNGPHSSGSGATSGYQTMRQSLASLPNDGRVRYANYGKGVLEWESDAQASCFVNAFQQIVSTDYYWFTDPNARGNPRYGFGSSYGDDVSKVRRLDALDGVRQPVWHFVELGWPATESATAGGRRILPAEIRSAVWHALIAGARGIIYFDHNFGPGTPGSTILEEGYEDNRVAASQVNAQVKALAPVLNGSFVTSGHSATDTMTGTVRYMVKWANAKFYLFAGADRGGGSATFSIPCVGNATAVVEGENRSLPVTSGSFTDQFADKNAIHIYRIDGGSTCGLN
jgi:chitodextrinase